MLITVVICTHDRLPLLRRTLEFLDAAERPADDVGTEVLVVANACRDGTHDWLAAHSAEAAPDRLPLRWAEEPRAGKSNALNLALSLLGDAVPAREHLVAFVDDDHRVDPNYLTAIARAGRNFPEATLFCGRILPDWDGREPAWVHDTGPYRIYPLPVPRFERGPEPRIVTPDVGVPGGGNLVLRREVFDRVGGFTVGMGPQGHNLAGGEDSEFVLRAMGNGEVCQYVPSMTQHHYVDLERLRFGYLLRKAYQRTRATARLHETTGPAIPAYMLRKAATYLAKALVSARWARTRFYLVRLAAVLGEMKGRLEADRCQGHRATSP
jgi:GT2 family glycosyltransferase